MGRQSNFGKIEETKTKNKRRNIIKKNYPGIQVREEIPYLWKGDLILLAVKPQSFLSITKIINTKKISSRMFLSIMAGVNLNSIEKLINLFKVKSLKQLVIVFLVFSITGSLSVVLGEPIINFFFEDGFENNLYFWIVRIIIIFPLYQILLIIIGTIFGEFRYFWRIEKKILIRLKIIKSSSS